VGNGRAQKQIERRTYALTEAIVEVFGQREQLRPLEIAWEPPSLRHFTARFREW
jgi:tryptophanase